VRIILVHLSQKQCTTTSRWTVCLVSLAPPLRLRSYESLFRRRNLRKATVIFSLSTPCNLYTCSRPACPRAVWSLGVVLAAMCPPSGVILYDQGPTAAMRTEPQHEAEMTAASLEECDRAECVRLEHGKVDMAQVGQRVNLKR